MEANLFDRYVREVGRRLPKKQREDVQAELHSLLLDALQDRMADRGGEEAATEEDQVAILQELGPPAQVAGQYIPQNRYLIGPRFFDLYRIVVIAVLGSITLAHVVLLFLSLWGGTGTFSDVVTAFIEVFGGYIGVLLSGLGSVTLIFAILERVLPEEEYVVHRIESYPVPIIAFRKASEAQSLDAQTQARREAPWDPRTLPEIEDYDRVQVWEQVVGIVFLVLALILFNFFPEWIGASFVGSMDGGPVTWHSLPLLAPVFFERYLPLLNVLWIGNLGLSIVVLRQGRWQRGTRIVELVLTGLSAYTLYNMAFGPPLLSMDAVQPADLRDLFETIFPMLLKIGLAIGFLATIGEATGQFVRLVWSRKFSVRDLLDVRKLTGT
jgi:hypothetical protein